MTGNNSLRDCYYSETQYEIMTLLGCKMKVFLNGKPVSQLFPHGTKHELLKDEVFVGTEMLEKIECIEE